MLADHAAAAAGQSICDIHPSLGEPRRAELLDHQNDHL